MNKGTKYFSVSADNTEDLPMVYGDDFHAFSDEEQLEHNEKIVSTILRNAGIPQNSRLINLSMRDINKITKVVQDYKFLDTELSKNDEDFDDSEYVSFEDLSSDEMEKMIFQFIAKVQGQSWKITC